MTVPRRAAALGGCCGSRPGASPHVAAGGCRAVLLPPCWAPGAAARPHPWVASLLAELGGELWRCCAAPLPRRPYFRPAAPLGSHGRAQRRQPKRSRFGVKCGSREAQCGTAVLGVGRRGGENGLETEGRGCSSPPCARCANGEVVGRHPITTPCASPNAVGPEHRLAAPRALRCLQPPWFLVLLFKPGKVERPTWCHTSSARGLRGAGWALWRCRGGWAPHGVAALPPPHLSLRRSDRRRTHKGCVV